MMKKKHKYIFAIIVLIVIYIFGLKYSCTRLTYLEYTTINEKNDTYIVLDKNENELKQEFIMSYDILDSISVQVGTFQRDNNSRWIFSILNSSGKTLYTDTFNASRLEDNKYYRHKINKKLNVIKGDKYYFSIKAKDVSNLSKLAFCVSSKNNIEDTILIHNGNIVDNTLCFKIYGGNRDYWWHGLVTFIFLYFFVIICRFYFDEKKNKDLQNDKILQGLILGVFSFLLLCSFATGGSFTDENDNIRGGMVIANGGVLYKNYITQHTPVVYYLCSIFALLGAGSTEQFRLSYYIFESIVWIFLYIRHKDYFGKKKMILLPLMESICVPSVISPQGHQVLSDGFEGLMFIILMLEFLRYYKDFRLNWDRSILISICIWGSFGAAFISAYALVFLTLIFVGLEITNLIKSNISMNKIINRYYKLVIAITVPFISAIVYFKTNHALRLAFEQFYTFNREVYPKYMSGLGEKIVQPFVNGVQSFFNIIANNFNLIITASATNVIILQFAIIILAVGIIIKLLEQKEFIEALSLGLMMMFSATRGYGFHGLAAWYLAILIIVIYIDLLEAKFKKIGKPFLGIFAIVLSSTYFIAVGNNFLYEQESISELESRIIDMTEKDESKDIFLDAYCCDSLYLFYKDRKPVNPAVYMLPWYMDWYEKIDVDALLEKQPHIVVYNEDRATWEITHYTYIFDNELKIHYTRLGDEGWKYSVWVKNK